MNKIFYRIGQFLFGMGALLAIIIWIFGSDWLKVFPECYIHTLSGIYCFGCGGTRALLAMLEFRFVKSFFYHPVVVYTAIIYIIFMVQYFIKSKTPKCQIRVIRMDIAMYIAIAIIFIQCIIKNVSLIVYGISWL